MRQLQIPLMLMALLAGLLSACAPADEAPLPTLAALPTLTFTFTPSATFTATETQTATPTPTATATSTATSTATPTRTPTFTRTPLPSATPTNTLTFTPTATLTPSKTFTPPATATSAFPSVRNFSSSVTSGQGGSPVELRWEADGDSIALETLSSTGAIISSITVPPIGATTATLPLNASQAFYRLRATRGGQSDELLLTIAVQPQCVTQWFFTSTPPASIGCPGSLQQLYTGAYQPFERGFYFRLVLGAADRVCGIQNDLQLYSCTPYAVYSGTPPATPPSGLQPPAPEFANQFYTTLAIGGTWYGVIGWGTAPGSSSALTAQLGQNGRLYVLLPTGVYEFDGALTSGSLVKIQ
jgi:hypothetical protein